MSTDGVDEIPFPEMPRQGVPDHQILLSFRDDRHAEVFADWLAGDGWPAFRARAGLGGEGAAAEPDPVPPGRYGRIEIPGYRENEGWICEETRFGLQVAVVRDREGAETAAVGIGPLCRVVWLPVPDPRPEPMSALPAGRSVWVGPDDEDLDDEAAGPF